MSDLRVALVAEGPTDAIVIAAALKELLPRPFVLTQLQPESTRPKLGTGWGGVLRWCLEFAMRGYARMEDDPTLPGFDLFVIHVDADVAEGIYADVSDELVAVAKQRGWPVLPSNVPCPPPTGSVDAVRACLLSTTLAAIAPHGGGLRPSLTAPLVATCRFATGDPVLDPVLCQMRLETVTVSEPVDFEVVPSDATDLPVVGVGDVAGAHVTMPDGGEI